MRKRVNILFVALATCSVVYGMILRYTPEQQGASIPNDSSTVTQEVTNYDDGIVDLDALELSNPD